MMATRTCASCGRPAALHCDGVAMCQPCATLALQTLEPSSARFLPESAAEHAARLAAVEYRGALRQMMEIGWVAYPIYARRRDVLRRPERSG